jgi:hypothetical protein
VKIKTVLTVVFFLVIVPGSLGFGMTRGQKAIPSGITWKNLGGALNVEAQHFAEFPAIAMDVKGDPTIAWSEANDVGSVRKMYVKRWDGTQWIPLDSEGLNADLEGQTTPTFPSLALDAQGHPIVSWSKAKNSDSPAGIYVKRWDGNKWIPLGSTLLNTDPTYDAYPSQLLLDPQGKPFVAWSEQKDSDSPLNLYVKSWNGQKWEQVGSRSLNVDPEKDAAIPALVVDTQGYLNVAWDEGTGRLDPRHVYTKRWDGNDWVQVSSMPYNIGQQDAYVTSLTLDAQNILNVGWTEGDKTRGFVQNVYIQRWNQNKWTSLGLKSLNINPEKPAGGTRLTLDSNGNPFVAWTEQVEINDSYRLNLFVKHWDGTDWAQENLASLNIDPQNSVLAFSLTVDAKGNPSIVWCEGRKIYVKRGLP